jgi:hypothetical protein
MKDYQPKQSARHQWGPTQCHQQKSKLCHQERRPLRRLPNPKLVPLPCNQNAEEKTLHEHPWKYERENPLGHPRGLGHSSRYPSEPDHLQQHPRGLGVDTFLERQILKKNRRRCSLVRRGRSAAWGRTVRDLAQGLRFPA